MKISVYLLMLIMSVSIAFSQNAKNQFMDAYNAKNYEAALHLIEAALAENPKDVDLHLAAGDVYLDYERNELALQTFKAAERLSKRPFVMRKLAQGLSATGDFPEAVKIIRKLTNDEKNEVSNWLLLADVYITADSIRQAELAVTRAREMDRNNVRAYIVLGDIYYAQRVYELSKNNYEEALKLDPNLNDARMKLAQSYYWLALRENDYDQDLAQELFNRSLQEWNTLTQKEPNNASAWFEQGKLFFFSKNHVQAAQSLNNYIQLRPSGSLGRWYLAQSLYELGRCDSARTHLRIVSQEIDTAAFSANLLLARCFVTENDYENAVVLYGELENKYELEMEDIRRYGQAALFAGDTLKAVDKWKKAIEMDAESNCQLMYILGTSLNRMKRYDEAIDMLNKRLETKFCDDSLNYIIHYFIGLSHFFNDSTALAIEPLQTAVALNPNFLWAAIYLGDVYANMSENEKAEEQFSKVIAFGSVSSEQYTNELNQAFFKLAGMKLEQKKYRDLEKVGKDWMGVMPESEYAPLFTAFAFQGLNNIEGACRHYKMSLRINPDNKTAKDNLRALNCD